MTSQTNELHFLIFPLMSPGHMNPMIDIARLLAQRGIIITIVTTPHNAARFAPILGRDKDSGLQIQVIQLNLPCEEEGIPKGVENFDLLSSLGLGPNLFFAASLLEKPVENLLHELKPKPNCVISDVCLPWTINIANMLQIPRISFSGTGCFCLYSLYNLQSSNILQSINSDSEFVIVPNLPDQIEVTKAQFSILPQHSKFIEYSIKMVEADKESYGVIINTFEELETEYAKQYKKIEEKVWCFGPVSLCNKDSLDKVQRGNKKSEFNEFDCLNWLNKWGKNSVLYACLGSMCNFVASQWIEFGLGLEASNKPFIWVIREGSSKMDEVEKWIKEVDFEERNKERGLLIRGWAPQVLILSHPSIGGFLTHCGWNSTLEGISYGVPLVTWPLFADQFFNEKLVVQVLKIGVSVGVVEPVPWGEEEKVGVLVNKESVKKAIEELMNEGEEGKQRRKRVRELAEKAKRAVEEGGSSYVNIDLFIQEIRQLANNK